MKLLRIRFSLLIISLLFFPCSIWAGDVDSSFRAPLTLTEKFAPLGSLKESLLFKAGFNVFGDYYSGLVLIKEMPETGARHIVFLSELGLNLLEMIYLNDDFKVVNVQEFLNRRFLLKSLQKDFRCLLLDLSEIEDYKVKLKDDGANEILKFRHRSQRFKYSYNEKLGPYHIRSHNGLFCVVDFQVDRGEPLKIQIDHRIRVQIVLTELKR